ncbi:MAG: hypothetical protein COB04_18950 [Gammaproteobacteria bacterium]|nr:MAG: hypothetical protein COB04_18950 [Gammaproteobacteria bacterium]
MSSTLPVSGNVDHSLIQEFFDDYNEAHELCEETILKLEVQPDDKALLNKIFRAVHNVKGNLVYVNLKHITPLLQSIEDVLDDVRKQIIPYNPNLSDVILLGLDTTKILVMERVEDIEHSIQETQFNDICGAIHSICHTPDNNFETSIEYALSLLNPPSDTEQESPPTIATNSVATLSEISATTQAAPAQLNSSNPFIASQQAGMLVTKIASQPSMEQPPSPPTIPNTEIKPGDELNADMNFFAALSKHIETRSCYWEGRTERILELALAMNTLKGERTDPVQLTAAVYMHDFGMAFLPIQLLHKKDQLNFGDNIKIRRHPKMAYDFLRRMGQWDMAATIAIQHHERLDGNGYPRGLKGNEICDGAKILSIIDTFDARTHDRAHLDSSRHALISSVFELNRHAGGQFSDYWIDAFQTTLNQQQK